MRLVILFGLMALLLVSMVAAETCFTAVNVPQSNKYFWKAVTYTDVVDGNYASYLTKPNTIGTVPSLGAGYQYQIRAESDCFGGFLLSNADTTGITTSQLTMQRKDVDYFTTGFQANKVYTVSVSENEDRSTKLVNQITTGTIEGINYLNIPTSFLDMNKHQGFNQILNTGLCDRTLTIANQMDQIKLKVWAVLEPTDAALVCSQQNIVDCAIGQNKGRSQEYAALVMLLARKCGVPARVAYGIGEAQFDGVDMVFLKEKATYWVEFYDNVWYEMPTMEAGAQVPTSIELNCIDTLDNDLNGNTDCWDKACSEDYACSSWPVTTAFNNAQSTNIAMLPNPYDINNLTLGNQFGSVAWTNQHIDLRGKRLDNMVTIAANLLTINNQSQELNKDAVATLMVQRDATGILKNGLLCDSACIIKSTTPTSVTFTIPGAGKYSAQFANISTNMTDVAPGPAPAADLPTRIWNRIKEFYNKRTLTEKVIGAVIIAGVLFLIFRPKRPAYYPR